MRSESTLSVKSWEKHKINGITVMVKRLGNHAIEIMASNRKKEFQQEFCDEISETSFASEAERTDKCNVVCRLHPTAEMTFNKLIDEIVNLFVRCVERHTESAVTKSATEQASHPPRTKKRRSRRYHKRHHTPITALTTT